MGSRSGNIHRSATHDLCSLPPRGLKTRDIYINELNLYTINVGIRDFG